MDKSLALQENKEGLLPIEEAIDAGYVDLVRFLLNLKDCNYPDRIYKMMISINKILFREMMKKISLLGLWLKNNWRTKTDIKGHFFKSE